LKCPKSLLILVTNLLFAARLSGGACSVTYWFDARNRLIYWNYRIHKPLHWSLIPWSNCSSYLICLTICTHTIFIFTFHFQNRDSSLGIATGCGLDGRDSLSLRGKTFLFSWTALGPTQVAGASPPPGNKSTRAWIWPLSI
jgi:hypothetical protein